MKLSEEIIIKLKIEKEDDASVLPKLQNSLLSSIIINDIYYVITFVVY